MKSRRHFLACLASAALAPVANPGVAVFSLGTTEARQVRWVDSGPHWVLDSWGRTLTGVADKRIYVWVRHA